MKWSNPNLVDLSKKSDAMGQVAPNCNPTGYSAAGDCWTGSNAEAMCKNGTAAGTSCSPTGTTPSLT